MLTPTRKPKKCRNKSCGATFVPARPLQKACGLECAQALAEEVRAKKKREEARRERAHDRARLEQLKPISRLLAETQRVFNSWIRERDKNLPCISCGRYHQGSWDAGHYMTTGARSELRFDEANVHRQCVPCNQHLSGNLIAYRIGLIARIGEAEVRRLEGATAPHKWTRDEIAEIKKKYSAKRRELMKESK